MYRAFILLLVIGCDNGLPQGGNPSPDAMPMPDAADNSPDAAPQMVNVTFSYTPQWQGVTAVTVLGGFGQSSDWTQPLVALTNSGSGTFTATTQLPAGQYPYVFHVTGDTAAANPATYARYSIDPANPQYIACPMASPTFSMNAPNPCSLLDTSATAPTLYHVRGTATVDGAAANGWLAVLEREEMSSHHFFVNRATIGSDGSYDLQVAPGTYRVQIQHPTFISQTDSQLAPLTLQALRRALSNAFMVSADHMLPAVEVAYHGYAQMTPQTGMGTLPVTFAFSMPQGDMARAAVYGGSATNFREIGDPWFASTYATATSVSWNGAFNTQQATQTTAVTGQKYYWGTWLTRAPWTLQTMVFPLTLQ
jgi:hypothetical protein